MRNFTSDILVSPMSPKDVRTLVKTFRVSPMTLVTPMTLLAVSGPERGELEGGCQVVGYRGRPPDP